MLSSPPSTTNSPASQRTRVLKRFSKSSGIVITPAARSGPMMKPVRPTIQNPRAINTPTIAPASPFSKPSWAVYMMVTKPISVAAREAMPRLTFISRPATAKSSTPRT